MSKDNPPVWIEGKVKAVSQKDGMPMGVMLVERDEHWFNQSKFADGPIMTPEKGEAVKLLVKDDKWIVQLIPANGAAPEQGEALVDPQQHATPATSQWSFQDKDWLIAREVALKAAIDFHVANGEATADDVVTAAETFMRFLKGLAEE